MNPRTPTRSAGISMALAAASLAWGCAGALPPEPAPTPPSDAPPIGGSTDDSQASAGSGTPGTPAPPLPVLELPPGWADCSHLAFEALVARLDAAEPGRFAESDLRSLAQALALEDERSVRSAVLLARCGSEDCEEVLIGRLEGRFRAPSRERDAGDLVAAAALAGRGIERGLPRRLALLAVGPGPHPDLEVRVEAARSALQGGEESVIPFLLRVLRARTPAAGAGAPDWEPTKTMAWAKSRAAEALSERAGVPCAFRADGSWQDQMREAQRLEELLRP